MKKTLMIVLMTTCTSFAAHADGPEVKLTGGIEVQAGYVKNSKPVDSKNYVTGNNKRAGIESTVHVLADAHNTTESGVKYGAKIGLATTARIH